MQHPTLDACTAFLKPHTNPTLLPRRCSNAALAKQVVLGCERSGALPALRDLLVEPTWKELLGEEMEKPYFRELERFVQAEWGGKSMIFPPKDAVFR